MASNRDPVELPPIVITPDPIKPPQLPELPRPPQNPRPIYQSWDQKILSPDAFGNLPFTTFNERYTRTMAVVMLDSTREMQLAYEQARAALVAGTDKSLADAGYIGADSGSGSTRDELQSDLVLVRKLLSDTTALLAQNSAKAGQFFGGRDPHGFNGVEAFNYMNDTKQLYGKGVVNNTYRAWIASYQAQYAVQLLQEQLDYLKYCEALLLSAQARVGTSYTAPIKTASGAATVMSAAGAVRLAANTLLSLTDAIALAAGRALAPVAAGIAAELAAVLTLALIPSSLGNSDRYPTSVPLKTLHTPNGNLQALAAAKGEVQMPVRLGTHTTEQGVEIYAVATGVGAVPSKVKVRAAQYNAARNRFSFTTEGSEPITLVWTPAINPGDASTTRPLEEIATPDYTGPVVTTVDPYIEIYPGVAEGSFEDYVIVFPADSGLEPIYVMFKDRRSIPGTVRGQGKRYVEPWIPMAAQPQGAPIPWLVGQRLVGKTFSSFDAFRKAFWIAVSNAPDSAEQFDERQIERMRAGVAPYAPMSEQVGGREKYEIHHVRSIADGGKVYSLDNLRIMTPRRHIELHSGKGSGQ